MLAGTYGEKFRKGESNGLCCNTFVLIRAFLAADFFVFGLARGFAVLVLRPEPVCEGEDVLAVFPVFDLLSSVRRVDVVVFDPERDVASLLAFGLIGLFLDFAADDFLAGILTSYPYARNGVTPEQAA